MRIVSGRQNTTSWKGRHTPAALKEKNNNWKSIIANTTVFYCNFTPQERSVNVFCVQIETALSGRHCILKHGHDVCITLSRSIHVTLTQPGQNTQGLPSTMPKKEGDRLLCFPRLQFTHYRGLSAFHQDFNREQVSEK